MPPERRADLDPQLAKLNRDGTIELCHSLADYAEAGGLSRDLMLRAGRHASARWPADLDVLLAVARMYQIGGELTRARATLIQAGKLAPEDPRVLRLLRDVLQAAGVTDAPEDVLADASDELPKARPPPLPTPKSAPLVTTSAPSGSHRRVPQSRIKLLDHDDPTRLLDPYELIGEFAAGGMASVFLARLTGAGGFQRFVAIKRLHPHLAREQEFVEMFLDEARLAAGIHHPNVVAILEIGQSDAGYYLVMEFIEGDTLATLISRVFARGVMLPRAVAARILFDALTGLHAAHQLKDPSGRLLGLIHRDCTPQNILVGIDGSSRLTDFGVARAASRYAITRSQVVKGKVAYLSPEQASAGALDRRSDLFSMGIVLWEALAGRPLFLAENDAVTISRLLTQPIPSIRNFSPDVTPALDEVCGRALQRDPSRRFPTAATMADAIERAARSSPGGLASPGDVARCVEDLIGPEVALQREAVRGWLAQRETPPMSRAAGRTSSSFTMSAMPAPAAAKPATEAAAPAPPPEPEPPTQDAARKRWWVPGWRR